MPKKDGVTIVELDLSDEEWEGLEYLMGRWDLDAQKTIERCIENAAEAIRQKDREAGRAEE